MYALSNLLLFFILLLCVVRKYYADASLRVRAYVYTEKKTQRETNTDSRDATSRENEKREVKKKKRTLRKIYIDSIPFFLL